ncbi:MAG: hypothetical protein LBU62_00170 [Bacteroidales bacterium]|jgi:hypothetical protein|nr:hypothetical protein [Bacteroidales bacterium]
MRKKTTIWIFLFIAFLVFYYFNRDSFVKYKWIPTYSTADKQPFGCFAFDSLLSASLENGYYHSYASMEKLLDNSHRLGIDATQANFLIIRNAKWIHDSTFMLIYEHIRAGSNIILATSSLPDTLQQMLHTEVDYLHWANRYPVHLCDTSDRQQQIVPGSILDCYITPSLVEQDSSFDEIRLLYRISETADQHKTLSIRYNIGEGNLIIVCNPLFFTNYGILNDSISPYIWQHLGYVKNRPLIRTEYYSRMNYAMDSGIAATWDILTRDKPMSWALIITLLTLLIFILSNLKRKQKPIPIIRPPKNMLLDFVRSITNLYIRKNNNADIVMKRRLYLSEELKRKHGIDIVNQTSTIEMCNRLAQKTGCMPQDIRRCLLKMNAINENIKLTDKELMDIVKEMNQLNI